jgi:hypothetical protein
VLIFYGVLDPFPFLDLLAANQAIAGYDELALIV